jgi:hypothetical protein
VAETVHDTLGGEDAAGGGQVFRQSGCYRAAGLGRLRHSRPRDEIQVTYNLQMFFVTIIRHL